MMRTLIRERGWLGSNLAILLAYVVVFALGQAIILLLASPDGSIAAGWSGGPATQILGWATMAGWIIAFSSPLLAVVLVLYRILAQLVGRPRVVAIAMSLGITALVGVLVPRVDGASVGVLGIALVGYATLMRAPGQTLAGLPPAVRGLIVGLALGCVWLVGSLVALGWAVRRASRGDWTEAGAVAVAGTAIPATLIFMDLFRADVPGTNYLISALLLCPLAGGLAALIGRPIRAMRVSHPR